MKKHTALILVLFSLSVFAEEFHATKETKQGLKTIERIVDGNKIIKESLSASAFLTLSSNDLIDVASYDWDLWAESFTNADKLTKSQISKAINTQLLNHDPKSSLISSDKKQIKLNYEFWKKMDESLD